MQEIRCANCRKLLAKAQFLALEIKCPRCRTINTLRAESPAPERHRAPDQERQHDQTYHSVDWR
ncbi:Com family DNA-binding transcriptional regulator [Marinobacterium stanieri]|uniref:Com family DNA-binding transcriptional regulator n=1 Tax=Marinobacterium stanieri TaxID=49186 RepID=UPI000255A16A|nr:Com family DNA-binding transcriptional regulator [Marinobacterium stanieri]